jgi:glycosyltransferase involved in cell wall biosynthesis
LRIALMGTRGIPANYGGFETCVEEIAPRLAALGHDVTVYCRTPQIQHPGNTYRGVRLRKLPTIRNKYLDTIFHSTISALHALLHRYDVVLMFGVGNSPVCALLRAGRLPVILNVDGLDWKRDKWPPPAKALLRLAEKVATHVANRTITDSRHVQHYYRTRFGVNLDYIPYGASPALADLNGTLKELGLEPEQYFLYVGRLEPENHVHDLVEASRVADPVRPVIIVGDAPYADDYKRRLKRHAPPAVRFPGAIYGPDYWELNHHAYAYVFPVQSSGTHPALIEAMASSNCVLVRDTPDNRAVGGDAVRYFKGVGELVELMRWAETDPHEVRRLGELAAERARELYNWDRVTADYLRLAAEVVADRRPRLVKRWPGRAHGD